MLMKKPELVAPAGNMEKLRTALLYGADAVYVGLRDFSLRTKESEMTLQEIKKAVRETHRLKKKIYVALNVFFSNEDLKKIKNLLKKIKNVDIDALIVSDPSILHMAREICPNIKLHLSTQVNVNNWGAVNFWNKRGIGRINLARELSFNEIKEIRKKTKGELEAFIHGSMCMAYSGRCNLSYYLVNRSANKGLCAHPCRWKYYLIEEERPTDKFEIVENTKGTYIFNSKDLCMIEYIPQLVSLGLNAWKIEGRMKTSYYLAVAVRAYRSAIDEYFKDPKNYEFKSEWIKELKKVSYRGYCSGFYLGNLDESSHNYDSSGYIKNYNFVGLVKRYDKARGLVWIEVRNRIRKGDILELIFAVSNRNLCIKIDNMLDDKGNLLKEAHNGYVIGLEVKEHIPKNVVARVKIC